MKVAPLTPYRSEVALTFIEMVIVIAVIGIMSALAISTFSNASTDAREIVARQQQATVQSAVNAWVVAQLSSTGTVSEVRTTYNAADTSEAKLTLVKDYLDDPSYTHFTDQDALSPSDEVQSAATRKLGWHISLPEWASGSYPKVELVKSAPDAE